MTLNTTTNKVQYVGNGATTVFAYTFKIFANTDLKVYVDDANGAPVLQTLTTHYTVSGVGLDAGGNVTFLTAPLNLRGITIIREVPQTQGTAYPENFKFPAKAHEDALDKLTMLVQQLNEKIGRQPILDVNTDLSGLILPESPNPAGKFFRWNSTATALELVDVTTLGSYVNPITAKGDVLVGGAAGLASRLPVGTNGQFIVADSAEALGVKWTDTFSIPVKFADGTAAAPSIALANAPASGLLKGFGTELSISANGTVIFTFLASRTRFTGSIFQLSNNGILGWANTDTNDIDLALTRDAANILAQRNGVNAQTQQWYNTFTDTSNFERGFAKWGSNIFSVGTEKLGTGVARALRLVTDGADRWEIAATTGHLLAVSDNAHDIGGSGASRPRDLFLSRAVIIGTNPASVGAVRLANNEDINARNAANSNNIVALRVNVNDLVEMGAGLILPSVSGTPAQHALYRENVPKAWGNVSSAPALNDSFNITSVADAGAGLVTVTFDRDFVNATYSPVGSANSGVIIVAFDTLAVGSMRAILDDNAGTLTDTAFYFVVLGDQ